MKLEDSLITDSVTHINGQCWETLKIFNLKNKAKHSTYLWKWFELNGLLEMAVENLKLECKCVLNVLLLPLPRHNLPFSTLLCARRAESQALLQQGSFALWSPARWWKHQSQVREREGGNVKRSLSQASSLPVCGLPTTLFSALFLYKYLQLLWMFLCL